MDSIDNSDIPADHPCRNRENWDPDLKAASDNAHAMQDEILAYINKRVELVAAALQEGMKPEDTKNLKDTSEMKRARQHITYRLALLRNQNRNIAMSVREDKAKTAKDREEVEALQLDLQNRIYEHDHVLKEIEAIKNYPHSHLKLDMIPEEEFLKEFPEWLEKRNEPEGLTSGQQGLMRARIEHERRTREQLRDIRQAKEKELKEFLAETARRRQNIAEADAMVEKLQQHAARLEKFLNTDPSTATAPKTDEPVEAKQSANTTAAAEPSAAAENKDAEAKAAAEGKAEGSTEEPSSPMTPGPAN